MNITESFFKTNQPVSPFVMVIFGATGDLTGRKLIPALYHLLEQQVLPDKFLVVGMARRFFSHEEFRKMMREAVLKSSKFKVQSSPPKTDQPQAENQVKNSNDEIWGKLEKNLFYQQGMFEDNKPYEELVKLLKNFDNEIGACITRFFYLATPPENYSTILTKLATAKLSEGCGQGSNKWTRILIEKPFGKDLETARQLEKQLSTIFEEKQIYRIDHYLAKETIQNIMAFRFANRLFEPLWNREHIDHVQLTLFEKEGIGKRGKFYDGIGALRDTFQNHLMAMLAFTGMEEPAGFEVESVRHERVKVLKEMRILKKEEVAISVVRGQYRGYREEKDVTAGSCTETYVAAKLYIDNPRWRDVPFYLRTGKNMKESVVRVDVVFKPRFSSLYRECTYENGSYVCRMAPGVNTKLLEAAGVAGGANILTIHIQPREGVSINFFAKKPGLDFTLMPVEMDFSYSKFIKRDITNSYEKLLLDAILGDQMLFATSAGFGVTWEQVTAIMEAWDPVTPDFPNYEPGTWGPESAEKLVNKDGREWVL